MPERLQAQFLPSSYLNFAVSYGKGKTPDLHFEADAIASIANYLVKNGYKSPLIPRGKEGPSPLQYSDVYVETIINVAKKLKGLPIHAERKSQTARSVKT